MATVITHAFIGYVAGRTFLNVTNDIIRKESTKKFFYLVLLLPMVPDIDVLAFKFGIPYAHIFGHRGISHSLAFAAVLGILAAILFYLNQGHRKLRLWLILSVFFSFLVATHGIIDMFTNGGLGIAIFAPFDQERYFFPWTPLEVSPIGVRRFFSQWGLKVAMSELLYIWIPCIGILILSKLYSLTGRKSNFQL